MLENRKKVSFDSSLHAKVSLFSFSIHCATTSFYHLVTSLDKNSTTFLDVIQLLSFERCALLISLHNTSALAFAFLIL